MGLDGAECLPIFIYSTFRKNKLILFPINNELPSQQIPENGLHVLAALQGPRGARSGAGRDAEHVPTVAVAVPAPGTECER